MNEAHLRICASPEWATYVENELLPWVLGREDLGDDVLEVGPGPGLTTDVLRKSVPRLTVVEVDEELATRLAQRLVGSNVEVIRGDGTELPFDTGRFSAATLFTMLHHVPSPGLQDQLLAELCRVLCPGGVVIGVDSIDTPERQELHVGDVFVPVDPDTFDKRMAAAGFVDVLVEAQRDRFRFIGRSPNRPERS